MPAQILDQFGRPVDMEALLDEQGAPGLAGLRRVWHSPVAAGLGPERLATILRTAGESCGSATEYLTLAEEMEERDAHYRSVLGTRKLAVAGLPATVEAAGDDAREVEIADLVRAAVAKPLFGQCIVDLMDALGKGYSAVEIMWDRSGARMTPKRYVWRDPRFFRFDRVAGEELRLLDESDPFNGIALAPYKWIVHRARLKTGLPIRSGLARLVAAAYMCKSFGLRDWMAFAEVFGMPLRIGRYGPQATESQIRTLVNAVANIGTDAAAVIPDSMKVEFQAASNAAGGPDLFRGLAEWLDRQVSKAVLGQTMTADDGSSRAQATVHNEVRGDLVAADVFQLECTLNESLVVPLVDLNFGPQETYPKLKLLLKEPRDLKALTEALIPLVDRGLRVEESQVRDWFGIAEPAEGALTLKARAEPSPAPVPAMPAALQRALNAARDPYAELQRLAGESTDDWRPIVDPMLAPVEEALSQSKTPEEFLKALDGLAGKMDDRELRRRLALAMFKARGLGDAGPE